MSDQEMIYCCRRAIRNLKTRLLRTEHRWGNEESYLKRLDLERIMAYLESQIEEYRDRIAYYKKYA